MSMRVPLTARLVRGVLGIHARERADPGTKTGVEISSCRPPSADGSAPTFSSHVVVLSCLAPSIALSVRGGIGERVHDRVVVVRRHVCEVSTVQLTLVASDVLRLIRYASAMNRLAPPSAL